MTRRILRAQRLFKPRSVFRFFKRNCSVPTIMLIVNVLFYRVFTWLKIHKRALAIILLTLTAINVCLYKIANTATVKRPVECDLLDAAETWPPDTFSVMPPKTAIFVINRKSSETDKFLKQFCKRFLRQEDNVTAFVFFSNDMAMETASHGEQRGQCRIINVFTKHSQAQFSASGLNRCDVYLAANILTNDDNADRFNHVFSFDSTLNFNSRFSFKGALDDHDFLSFAHMSLALKNGRWTDSAITYSSKAFGGLFANMADVCQKLRSTQIGPYFQMSFNTLLRQYPPSLTLYVGPVTRCALLRQKNVVLVSQMDIPNYPNKDELDYWKALEVLEERSAEKQRQALTTAIVGDVKTNYLPFVKQTFSDTAASSVKFVTSICNYPKGECYDDRFLPRLNKSFLGNTEMCFRKEAWCSGFGDRLRGTIIAFYLALSLKRPLHIAWETFADPSPFFDVNLKLYDVDESMYNLAYENAVAETIWILHNGEVKDKFLKEEFSEKKLPTIEMSSENINFMSNRFSGLEAIVLNKRLAESIHETLPSAPSAFSDYLPLMSAALRVLLSSTTEKFQATIDKAITESIGWEFWNSSIKLGVQLRTEAAEFHMGNRVTIDQVQCIVEEIRRIIDLKIRNPLLEEHDVPITVFITTDFDYAVPEFKKTVKNYTGVKAFSTHDTLNLKFSHIAHGIANNEDAWDYSMKTYLDWFFLTKMNYLIISRSGFGESAAWFSLKPTRRFLHWKSRKPSQYCEFEDYTEHFSQVSENSPDADIYDVL